MPTIRCSAMSSPVWSAIRSTCSSATRNISNGRTSPIRALIKQGHRPRLGAARKVKKADDVTPIATDRFKTNLPIWPFQEGHSALLVVTQTPDGAERLYQFDLTARKAGDCTTSEAEPGCPEDARTTAALSFTYPVEKAAEVVKISAEKKQAAFMAWKSEQAAKKEAEAISRLKQDIFYGQRNWNYQAKADVKYKFLAPSEVSDNGWLTEFQWPENVQQPTITIVDPVTGDERSVFPQAQGRMQIVNTTAEWFRLRLGKEAVMDIHNRAWSANRPDPQQARHHPMFFAKWSIRTAASERSAARRTADISCRKSSAIPEVQEVPQCPDRPRGREAVAFMAAGIYAAINDKSTTEKPIDTGATSLPR